MTTLVILVIIAILAVLLAVWLRQLFRKPLLRPADTGTVKLADARVGDAISIAGAAADFDDIDFTVERRNRYEAGPRRWIELHGQFRGRPVELYTWEGDGMEAALVPHPRDFTLADLGLAGPGLPDSFNYDGKLWRERFNKEFVLFRDSDSQGGSFHGWLFEDDAGKWVALIRKSEAGAFTASIARKLDPASVTIYRV